MNKNHDAETKKARTGRAFFACFGNLKLRVGPPEVGVIVRAIVVIARRVVASQHKAPRGKRGGGL